jgi:hypothetical protein
VIVLITYHSSTGNTEKMAQGAGAKAVPDTTIVLAGWRSGGLSADAVVGHPYFGNMSGEVTRS